MLRTLFVVILVVFLASVVLACSQHVSLKGINLKASLVGEKFSATTTDGTLASSKVTVGKSYTLMAQDENGPYVRGKVLVTKTRGRYCEGRLVTRT